MPRFYSQYAVIIDKDRIPFYLHSVYEPNTDLWQVYSEDILIPAIRVSHQNQCYRTYHTLDTDFTFHESKNKNIEMVVKQLLNEIHIIKPSIDKKSKLWYPDNLLEHIKTLDTKKYSQYINYLTNGE